MTSNLQHQWFQAQYGTLGQDFVGNSLQKLYDINSLALDSAGDGCKLQAVLIRTLPGHETHNH